MLIPLAITWYFYKKWIGDSLEIIKATARMTIQLLLIGYVLIYIFQNDNSIIGLIIILFMVSVSSFISFRNISNKSFNEYKNIFLSILVSGSFNLILVLLFVLQLEKLYIPQYVIPIAGMIFANSMNSISLVAERFEKESKNNTYIDARNTAFKAALIPQINSFLAVGLVSLPGMMTGQILSGVDPLIAVRYQIMVMAMILGSATISNIIYLSLKKY
jgi:putative ABC transport system permease protein